MPVRFDARYRMLGASALGRPRGMVWGGRRVEGSGWGTHEGKEGQQVPEMTDEIVTGISERYIELYEHITGETFVKENTEDIAARIEKNVTEWLTK